jgi:hypothetical protein
MSRQVQLVANYTINRQELRVTAASFQKNKKQLLPARKASIRSSFLRVELVCVPVHLPRISPPAWKPGLAQHRVKF